MKHRNSSNTFLWAIWYLSTVIVAQRVPHKTRHILTPTIH